MSDLNDATVNPGPEFTASTPGEFAARWNDRTDAQRQGWLDAVHDAFRRSEACWVQQHERIDEYRTALYRIEQLLNRHEGEQREPGRVLIPATQIRAALNGATHD